MDIREQMTEVIGKAPAELVGFYEADAPVGYPDSRINILSFSEAMACTVDMQDISVVARLGLWILDDANDSNPYALITVGPCSGAVIYFSHDPEPEIRFPDFASYLSAMRGAGEAGDDIDDVAPATCVFELDEEIQNLCVEDTEDSVFLACIYLPVCQALSPTTKEILANNSDFYLREALAVWLERKGTSRDLPLARQLAEDKYGQVSRPAAAAVKALSGGSDL